MAQNNPSFFSRFEPSPSSHGNPGDWRGPTHKPSRGLPDNPNMPSSSTQGALESDTPSYEPSRTFPSPISRPPVTNAVRSAVRLSYSGEPSVTDEEWIPARPPTQCTTRNNQHPPLSRLAPHSFPPYVCSGTDRAYSNMCRDIRLSSAPSSPEWLDLCRECLDRPDSALFREAVCGGPRSNQRRRSSSRRI
jgi:hypothetical protein